MIENSVLFMAYNQIQKLIRIGSGVSAQTPLSVPQLCLAGAASGSLVSVFLTPIELVKCQLQVGIGNSSGPFSLLRSIFKSKGLSGLYRGHVGTFLRETAGGAAWFGVYETAVKMMIEAKKLQSKSDLSSLNLMSAGALAGMSYNFGIFKLKIALYPADTIKSRMQTSSEIKLSFTKFAKDLYRAEGIRGLYRGNILNNFRLWTDHFKKCANFRNNIFGL
jgi:ornithine carrier protein